MNQADSSQTRFWTTRWEAGKIPWDLGSAPPALWAFLTRQAGPTRVLIPGCGSGYEAKAFHDAGHQVRAIDFSLPAVVRAHEVLGSLAHLVVHGNFFTYEFDQSGFDVVYERGFLCSLPPARWPAYATRMASLLRPGGRLVGLFLYGQEPEPPPYPLTEQLASELFGSSFRLLRSEPVADSVPVYQGMERWQEWEKIGDTRNASPSTL